MNIMKIIYLISAVAMFSTNAFAQGITTQKAYIKRDGTYVAPTFKTKNDGKMYNNYSTKGNVNPFSGKVGTKRDTQAFPIYNPPKSTSYKAYKPKRIK